MKTNQALINKTKKDVKNDITLTNYISSLLNVVEVDVSRSYDQIPTAKLTVHYGNCCSFAHRGNPTVSFGIIR